MQKLRSTFKRSRTPTGAEMKSQSSLEVPKQIRSASFDEIQLEAKKHDDLTKYRDLLTKINTTSSSSSPARSSDQKRLMTLRVPQLHTQQRSRSFDIYEKGSLLASSSSSPSKSSGSSRSRKSDTPSLTQLSGCYHCACVDKYNSLYSKKPDNETESDDNDEEEIDEIVDNDNDDDRRREGSPEIRVTLMNFEKTTCDNEKLTENNDIVKLDYVPGERQRRLSRQEAVISFPVDLPSILGPDNEDDDSRGDENNDDTKTDDNKCKLVVRDIFLTVPELKRDRAASVDSCFNNNKNGKSDVSNSLTVSQQSTRSKSVDIVLPTDQRTRYTALLPSKDQSVRGWVRQV